jgi:hypothetical protein
MAAKLRHPTSRFLGSVINSVGWPWTYMKAKAFSSFEVSIPRITPLKTTLLYSSASRAISQRDEGSRMKLATCCVSNTALPTDIFVTYTWALLTSNCSTHPRCQTDAGSTRRSPSQGLKYSLGNLFHV